MLSNISGGTLNQHNHIMNTDSSNFGNSYSVKEFRAMNNNQALDVVQSPETGKFFFACGRIRGAVSHKIDYTQPCVISEVKDKDTGEWLFVLHNKRTDNIIMSWDD